MYKLPEPCDNIEVVLSQLAHRLGAQKKGDVILIPSIGQNCGGKIRFNW